MQDEHTTPTERGTTRMAREFLNENFGIEIEMTGITRKTAAEIVAQHLNGRVSADRQNYKVTAPDGRVWEIKYDGSISTRRGSWCNPQPTDNKDYSVELVSPILTYDEDIKNLQAIVQKLMMAGAISDPKLTCGIHIHLNGAPHSPRSLRNFTNLIYARNDLLYAALQIAPERMGYCKTLDQNLIDRMTEAKPTTLKQIEDIWYKDYPYDRLSHYHNSRYHFLNLHSYFYRAAYGKTPTVELRGFNGTLHAGEIRSMIALALAMNYQALTQKSTSKAKPQTANQKFAMRTWLNRIGFIGKEFEACREHLTKNLTGSAAWRHRVG